MRFTRSLLLSICALAAAGAPALHAADDAWIAQEKRAKAPKLSLRDLDNQKGDLAQLKGKIVVVNFWATWCGPCKAEMPEFTKVHSEYRDRGVEFVGAANEPRANRDKVREFVQHLDIRFPIWMEMSVDHMIAFGLGEGLPGTAIIDPHGRVAARVRGVTDAAQLRSLLDRLLTEAGTAAAPSGAR